MEHRLPRGCVVSFFEIFKSFLYVGLGTLFCCPCLGKGCARPLPPPAILWFCDLNHYLLALPQTCLIVIIFSVSLWMVPLFSLGIRGQGPPPGFPPLTNHTSPTSPNRELCYTFVLTPTLPHFSSSLSGLGRGLLLFDYVKYPPLTRQDAPERDRLC